MRAFNNIVSVIWSFFRFSVVKLFHGKRFRFGMIERFSPGVSMELDRGSETILGKAVRAHSGTKIKVRNGAKLSIGSGASLNYNNIIICRDNISIGNGAEFGPGVYIYDHDHDFRADGGIKAKKYKTSPVVIGDNCWIGANVVILRGTVLGDNCVVGAGSIIKGKYEANSVIVQKRHESINGG